MRTNWFAFYSLIDARRAAVTFLRERAALLPQRKAREALLAAASVYSRELKILTAPQCGRDRCFMMPGDQVGLAQWTAGVRDFEQGVLYAARELEQVAVAEIDEALRCCA
jgi:hypothetical protein